MSYLDHAAAVLTKASRDKMRRGQPDPTTLPTPSGKGRRGTKGKTFRIRDMTTEADTQAPSQPPVSAEAGTSDQWLPGTICMINEHKHFGFIAAADGQQQAHVRRVVVEPVLGTFNQRLVGKRVEYVLGRGRPGKQTCVKIRPKKT